jgi:hypothetical protein
MSSNYSHSKSRLRRKNKQQNRHRGSRETYDGGDETTARWDGSSYYEQDDYFRWPWDNEVTAESFPVDQTAQPQLASGHEMALPPKYVCSVLLVCELLKLTAFL